VKSSTAVRHIASYCARRRQLALLVDHLEFRAILRETDLSTASLERQKSYPQAVDKPENADNVE